MNVFGKRIALLRKHKNLSINEIARKLEISPSTYRAWELGASIKGEPYRDLAKILGVSVSELLSGEKSSLESQLDEMEKLVKGMRAML